LHLRYQMARELEMAEVAKAIKITSRPARANTFGTVGHCIWCGNVPTVELLFHYEMIYDDEQVQWTIVEKHCDSCTKKRYPGVATSMEVPK